MMNAIGILSNEELAQAETTPMSFQPGLRTDAGRLPLKSMDVRARITGLLSYTSVRQVFGNSLSQPMEATYIFPLPDRAAVTSFRMKVGDRVIDGLIRERAQARREYAEAIQAGHRASIAEEDRPDCFTMRVGNILPGETAEVELTLTGPLACSLGEATYRFPLVIAPRYVPGEAIPGPQTGDGVIPDTTAVPDASRISPPVLLPGYPNPVQLSLQVDLDPAGLSVNNVRSSLHTVIASREPDGLQALRLEPGERLNRDFILRFQFSREEIQTSLRVVPDETGGEATFLLTIVPPASEAKAMPRDVIFLLDRSGSMGGWKMVAARRAVARMVDTLTPNDRFHVYAFDNTLEMPRGTAEDDWIEASNRRRYEVIEFLSGLDARGGTEMANPLLKAADRLNKSDDNRDRILVLVTDGQVGNEDQILRALTPKLRKTRVYILGIDQSVNHGLLNRLASAGGGHFELVESEERLDEVMDGFHRKISTPALMDLSFSSPRAGYDWDTVVPRRIPALFENTPLVVMGRCQSGCGALRVQGRKPGGGQWEEKIQVRKLPCPGAAASWARLLIRELEDRYAAAGEERLDLEKRIVDASLRFSVLSRFTAYVAVDASEVVNKGGKVQGIIQPVEMPEGWAMPVAALQAAPAPSRGESEHLEMFLDACCDMSPPRRARRTSHRMDAMVPGVPARSRKRTQRTVDEHHALAAEVLKSLRSLLQALEAGKPRRMAKMWTEFLELFGPLMETLEQERPGAPAVVALRAVRAKLRAYSLEGPVDSGELTRLLKIVEEGLLAIEGGNWDWDGCRPGTSPRDKFWK